MTNEDLAWSAGFFDGEGCISLKHPSNSECPVVFIIVGQKYREPLDFLCEGFGGRVAPYGDIYQWYLTDTKAIISFVEQILPYVKHPTRIRKLTLGLAIAKLVLPPGKHLTDRDRLLRLRLGELFTQEAE